MRKSVQVFGERLKAGHLGTAILTYFVFAFALSLLLNSQPFSAQTEPENMLGGVARSLMRGDINYLEYARWLMILAFPLIWVSLIASQVQHTLLYTLLRVGKSGIIWRALCFEALTHIFIYILALAIVSRLFISKWSDAQWLMLLLLTAHLSLISLIALRIVLMRSYQTIPLASILIIEGITFFLSQRWIESSPFLAGTWSMYLQSNIAVKEGFSIPLIVLIEIIAIFFLCVYTPSLRPNMLREVR